MSSEAINWNPVEAGVGWPSSWLNNADATIKPIQISRPARALILLTNFAVNIVRWTALPVVGTGLSARRRVSACRQSRESTNFFSTPSLDLDRRRPCFRRHDVMHASMRSNGGHFRSRKAQSLNARKLKRESFRCRIWSPDQPVIKLPMNGLSRFHAEKSLCCCPRKP